MIAAARENNVKKMKLHLASGESVNNTDNEGNTPLHIAVEKKRRAAFNFLLKVKGIQLEPPPDSKGRTLLQRAFLGGDDYFVWKLINKGVNVNGVWDGFLKGNTILHGAAHRKRTALALCLLKNGANMNSTNGRLGETPLMIACKNESDELIYMLLYYGADATIPDYSGKTPFERYRDYTKCCRRYDGREKELEYVLLETTFDDKATVSLSMLCDVMLDGSPWFPRLLEKTETVWYDSSYLSTHVNRFEKISPEYFELFITKFPGAVEDFLYCIKDRHLLQCLFNQPKILTILCEHGFGPTLINNMFQKLNPTISPFIANHLLANVHFESLQDSEGPIFCLLSYGLPVLSDDFYAVYSKYGYSSLFKLILHLDHNFVPASNPDEIKQIMCSMIVDYTVTFRNFPYSCRGVRAGHMRELLTYSSAPKLKAVCLNLNDDDLNETVKALPQVSPLLELARDSFRESLATHCKRTQLKAFDHSPLSTGINCNQFYTTIENLPIPDVCKKVLTYERKLYEFN